MSDIKQISIGGEAAAALFPSLGKRRTTRKKTSLTVNESRAPIEHRERYERREDNEQTYMKAINLQPSYDAHKEHVKETPTTIHIDNSQQHSENGAYSSNNSIGGRHSHLEPRQQHSEPRQQHSEPRQQHSEPRQQHSEPRQQQQQQRPHEDQQIVQQNIVLGPKKKIGAKIILSRKKKHIIPQPSVIKGKHKTRKVYISLSAHKKRITRARKMSKDTKKIPTEKIREQLIKKGLIKENSKAPEAVLRQIYTDAIVVAQKAL